MDKSNNPMTAESNKFENFFEYMFNFDEENKAKIINIIQYFSLSLIPVVILLKLIKNYFPEEDESKGSVEISVEVIAQLAVIFIGVWFIDRLVRYLPTLSKMNYHGFNEINFIIPILIILVTMQTKLGSKINILSDRVLDMWNGNQNSQLVNGGANRVKISQPIAGRHQPSQADQLDNSQGPLNGLQQVDKSVTMINSLPNQQNSGIQNNNFQQDLSFMDNEPMAANGVLGGGFGTSF
tara:strand:- start:1195 stop:1908 length:714 start_codon:yes stop_codon:yes gene_type:complete